ncbi:MAG: type I DNA topoisomerase [Bacteroidota bacterium]|nr:type I DNA topoisomerase [Bacteroidota bacterium]
MAKNLVIVESPAKAKTIEKFLGKDFQVESSFGHISDLPSSELGVDVDNNFKPNYVVSDDKKSIVKKLKDLAQKAEVVWLASDEDREGEAIAWHLAETLKLDENKTKRIVFHEITKSAIQKAIENPRGIDYNLVDAQQARRILDRLVGYELSPVLWKKIKSGLSAGRVQSVSVRLIVEREKEINEFNSQPVFVVTAEFVTKKGKSFKAKLSENFDSIEQAQKFLENNIGATFSVADVETKPAKKSPAAPFTTSTLQQEASRKLSFSVGQTMLVAQRLYEAGLITYMRTDSVNLSKEATDAIQKEIVTHYGEEYSKPRSYVTKSKGAQEAHEAIRPTDITRHSIQTDREQARLYDLIWKRTIASQMSDAKLDRTNLKVKSDKYKQLYLATGEVLLFEGFLKVYIEGKDEDDDEQKDILPKLDVNEVVDNQVIIATERFSKAPSRYTEASLVKKLEELGIGRPSTYAPTISTIISRNYVEKGNSEGKEQHYRQLIFKGGEVERKNLKESVGSNKGKLVPTDIGIIVNDFLINHFTTILDYNFTAQVERDFDKIASGEHQWTMMLKEFYGHFHPTVKEVEKNADRGTGERILGTDPKTQKVVLVRLAKFGPIAQIGDSEDTDKKFAPLRPEQNISSITLEEALELFLLPKKLGSYKDEEVEVNVGRFGPYIKFGKTFIALDKKTEPLEVTMDDAIEVIDKKLKADAPIAHYDGLPVQKGTGRFGPFIKWNDIFINVSKKYNFDNLSDSDIKELIEDKLKKESEKVIQNWEQEGIRIEKARWGRSVIIKGKVKVELSKDVDASQITLKQARDLIESKTPKKKK